jgi:ketosteroid isomerase-like protein
MRAALLGLALTLAVPFCGAALAAPRDEVRATYERFVAAQNDRDLGRVRDLLIDSPQFLWVSNGQSFWGRETLVERMSRFQRAEVWRALPDLDHATFVEVDAKAAYIHMPLLLQIGQHGEAVQDTRFLVSILFQQTDEGWRIAALFTTLQNVE